MVPAEGTALRAEVERQLIADLAYYAVREEELVIDWSRECPEGHCVDYLDGVLEAVSDIGVRNAQGELVAAGWIDFVQGGPGLPLHVFWCFLDLLREGQWCSVKKDPHIPPHLWSRLTEESRLVCAVSWPKDPLVLKWTRDRRS